jgi:hypothetical protein
MWVAILLGGWLLISLLAAPWIGRFLAGHSRPREEPISSTMLSEGPEPARNKPASLARHARAS